MAADSSPGVSDAGASDQTDELSRDSEATRWRETLSPYVPDEVLEEIRAAGERVRSREPDLLEAAVLFASIDGFAAWCENRAPEQVPPFLNAYMSASVDIIEEEGGMVDSLAGDVLMAVFCDRIAPREHKGDDSLRAVQAAIRVRHAIAKLRTSGNGTDTDFSRLRLRVGINTGTMSLGNVGSNTRMTYTVVGHEVNVAWRLRSVCPPGCTNWRHRRRPRQGSPHRLQHQPPQVHQRLPHDLPAGHLHCTTNRQNLVFLRRFLARTR